MPTSITDVDDFTDTVVGPADGDLRNSASVIQALQHLSNRTRYLANEQIITPATLGATTDTLTATGWSKATVALIQTSSIVGFVNGADGSVLRKRKTLVNGGSLPISLVNNATTAGTKFLTPGGEDNYILYGGESVDILLTSGYWVILDSQPKVMRAGPLLAGSAEILYASLAGAIEKRERVVTLPLDGISDGTWTVPIGTSNALLCKGFSSGNYRQGLHLPYGAVLKKVRVLVDHGSTDGTLLMSVIRGAQQKVSPYSSSNILLGSAETTNAGGFHLLETTMSETIDNVNYEYRVHVRSSTLGSGQADIIEFIEITFDDPGPRNY
jgi:hypothetical protein